MPDRIMSEIMSNGEIDTWRDAIALKQKSNIEWEKIREKIPDDLLNKTAKVLKECWENGFLNPHVREGKLIWSQMMGSEYGRKISCKCDLCKNDYYGGDCKGTSKHKEGKKYFKPCWFIEPDEVRA